MQTARYCGNRFESWVRASAQLDTRTGIIAVVLQLETGSVDAGPKGSATIEVHGAGGELLATIESAEVGIGGKPPGQAASQVYSAAVALRGVPARRAAALTIRVACTGVVRQPYRDGGSAHPGLQLTVK